MTRTKAGRWKKRKKERSGRDENKGVPSLAKLYIFDYDKELAELNRLKSMSDWFVENGYGTEEDLEHEY